MEQIQSDVRELIQLYNSAVDLKKRAEKKLIRFTNSLKEIDRKSCGKEIIHEINVVRTKIKADRQQKAEQIVRNSYAQLQNQFSESLSHQLQSKELQLEQLELNYKCQLEQQQQVINELKLSQEESRENHEEQILSLTEKNQQLLTLIEDLNKQIEELKSGIMQSNEAIEQYQNEEFKFLNNSNQLRSSQPLEVVKKRNATADSMEQCQFDTLASEMRYEDTSNYDKELLLGSSNKELEDPQQFSEIDGTITNLKLEIQTLQEDKLQEKIELQNQIEQLQQINSKNEANLKEELQTLQNNNYDLNNRLQLLTQQTNAQANEIQDQRIRLEQLLITQNQLNNLQKENTTILQEKDDLVNQIKLKDQQLKEQNTIFEQKLKQNQTDYDILMREIQQLRQQNNELKQQQEQDNELQTKFDIQDNKIKTLEQQYSILEQSNQSLQNQVILLEKQQEELQNKQLDNDKLLIHQEQEKINQLTNKVEDLQLSCENKDIKINQLQEELQNTKSIQDEKQKQLTEQYEEQLRQLQDYQQKQYSKTSSPLMVDDKYKDQINRLNDELRSSQLQIASFSTINTQLKQQLKEVVIKLQILLKIQPNDHQDLNELVRLLEGNLASCQSSPVKPIKRTSMTDATKLFLNKARSSIGSRGSLMQERRSHQFQTPNSNSAVEFDQILNDSDI